MGAPTIVSVKVKRRPRREEARELEAASLLLRERARAFDGELSLDTKFLPQPPCFESSSCKYPPVRVDSHWILLSEVKTDFNFHP